MLLHPEDAIDATALEQFRLPRSSGETVPGVAQPTMEATNGDELTRIRQALMRTGGNVVRAAQLLGLWRDALRYRMRRHGIRPLTLADLMQAPVSQPIDPLIVNARAPSGWEQKPVEVLWWLGYPDQALEMSCAALTRVQELRHPHSLAFALNAAALFHLCRREGQAVQMRAKAAMTLSIEQGFPQCLAAGMVFQGGAQPSEERMPRGPLRYARVWLPGEPRG